MKLRHILYDLTDVLLLHLILNIPSYVVELLPITPHWAFIIYLLGVAWAIIQLILGVQYRERILRWWERISPPAMWSISAGTFVLFAASPVDVILTYEWQF